MRLMTQWLLTSLAISLAPLSAHAADYPEKPIRFIVPYAAGGGTDSIARLMATRLTPILGQSIVVENRPGASSNIGTEMVARAPADGYTVLVAASNFTTSEALFNKPGWRTEDFTPVIQLTVHANVLVATPGSQLTTFKQFVDRTKSSDPVLSFGTPGVASAAQLALELPAPAPAEPARSGLPATAVNTVPTAIINVAIFFFMFSLSKFN